jgi:hypothetical protein
MGEAPRTAIFPSPKRYKRRPRRIYRLAKLALFGVVLAGAIGFIIFDRLAGRGDVGPPLAGASAGGLHAKDS